MEKRTRIRQEVISKEAIGKVLDVGYNQDPNPYLTNVDGYDLDISNKPENYVNLYNKIWQVPENEYDSIVLGEIIEHIIDLDAFMGFILSCLKPNGKLIITTPNPHYLGDILESWTMKITSDRGHIHSFSKHNLLNLLEHYDLKHIVFRHMYSQIPILGWITKLNLSHLFRQKYLTVCYK